MPHITTTTPTLFNITTNFTWMFIMKHFSFPSYLYDYHTTPTMQETYGLYNSDMIIKAWTLYFQLDWIHLYDIRYVGVVWFVFHVLQILSIRLIQQSFCCISKSTMTYQHKLDSESNLPFFGYGFWKYMFVDSWSAQLCSLFESEVGNTFETTVQSLFKHVVFMVFVL